MTWVWDNAPVEGTELLTLLVIADHASDDGTDSWPGIQTIARKTRRSERRVQEAVQTLAKKGLIDVEINAGGNSKTPAHQRPNRYTVRMSGVRSTAPQITAPGEVERESPVRSTAPKPSLEQPSKNRQTDELWNAMLEACGYATADITASVRGRINKALKELREVNATPQQIRSAANAYRRTYPNFTLTPNALVSNWAQLQPKTTETKEKARTCAICGYPLNHHDNELCGLIANGRGQ
jgi:hypothetical protein